MTGHTFGGLPIVNNDPAHHAYRVKTDDVVPEGTPACCKPGDLLYKATDCDNGPHATADTATDTKCARATNTGHCAVAWCRTDFILRVLDKHDDPTGTRPAANEGFMPNSLPTTCNRALSVGELDRIFFWLEKGAKYDGFRDALPQPKCNTEQTTPDTGACITSAAVCALPPANRPCD